MTATDAPASGTTTMGTISLTPIPIAELSPTLQGLSSRKIKAIVTLTWPYSSATGSVAFLLAEPDFRLRRTRGQVRVQFAGSSAKYVGRSHIASGDEVTLSLDGVEWIHDTANVAAPGRGIEYELKFTERLLLQFRTEGADTVGSIDIDHPAPEAQAEREPEPEPPVEVLPPDIASRSTPPPIPTINGAPTRIDHDTADDGVFSSPAFVKRSRTSYGSLFELDPFAEEDGTVPGKGRKRTRLSSVWKYASRSPTPEAEQSEGESPTNVLAEDNMDEAPIMTDEGCQTIGLEDGDAAEALSSFSRQAINVGGATYKEMGVSTQESHEFTHIPGPMQVQDQERKADFGTEQESRLFSTGFVADTEHIGLGPTTRPEELHERVHEKSAGDSLREDGYEDLYAASPRGHREESNLDSFEGFGVPHVGINHLDPSISEPAHQFVPEALHGELQEPAAHLQPSVSPDGIAGHSNDIGRTNIFHTAEAGERNHVVNGSSPPSSPLRPATQLYPDLDDLAQQNMVPTWGAPVSQIMYPDLQEAAESIEDHTSSASQPPRPITTRRSQSAQSQAVDLTENSDDGEEGDYPEEDGDGEGYTQSREQIGVEGSLVDEEIDAEMHSATDARDGYVHEAATRAGRYSQDIQEEPDGYYEDEYDEDEDLAPSMGFPGNRAEEEEELESIEDDEGDEDDEDLDEDEDEDEDEEDEEEDSESYDEDMEDYGTAHAPSTPKEPVVIDLLSSDDEDAEEPHIPVPPAISQQPSRSPAPALAESSDQSEESGADDDMRDNQDIASSDGEGDEELIVSRQAFQSQAQAIDATEGDRSDAELQDKHNMAPPGPLQVDTASAEVEATEASVQQGQEVPDQPSDNENDNSKMDIGVSEDAFVHADKSLPIQEESGDEEVEDLGSESSYNSAEEEVGSNRDQEDRMELDHVEVTNRTEADDHEEEANEVPSESAASGSPEARHSPQAITIGLDGTNEALNVESALPTLTGDDKSPPRVIENLKSASPSHEDNTVQGDGIELPLPDTTHVPEVMVSAETSFSTGLDTLNSVLVSQNTLITPFSTQTDEPPVDIEAGETKPEAEYIEPSSSIAVDQHNPTSNVEEPVTEEPTRDIPMASMEQTIAEETPKGAIEDVAGQDSTVPTVSGDGVEENVSTEVQDSKEAGDESHVEAANPPVVTLRRSHRRVKSRSAEPIGDSPQPEALETTSTAPRRSSRRITSAASSVEPAGDELQPPIPETTATTPRRSHRRIKSTASSVDANDIPPTTPTKSSEKNGAPADLPLPAVVHEPSTPKGHDASFELALSSLDSPSKVHDLRKPPGADLKLRLSRALRTELGDFTALKVLRYHLNHKLDVLAIATTTPPEPQRSKGGPRQYQITFNITDPSIGPNSVAEVQIFRPYKEALPTVQAGDGVLLRNLQVISVKNRGFGLRSEQSEASSWAVFKDGEEAEVRGPPVEYGAAEKNHIADLKTWYGSLDTVAMAKLNRANADKGSSPGKTPKRAG